MRTKLSTSIERVAPSLALSSPFLLRTILNDEMVLGVGNLVVDGVMWLTL